MNKPHNVVHHSGQQRTFVELVIVRYTDDPLV